tara:strand:- start:362 stop:634 length:273 start_codon:yes stop_codon:yes gene_type:complete
MIKIEIINSHNDYETQHINLKEGTTIHELVNNILNLDINNSAIGVHGKIQELTYTLQDRDRVEFYKDIIADPKIKRKNRAKINEQHKKSR